MVAGGPWLAVENVSGPTMTVYSPGGKNTGVAVIVFPGGGYQDLATDLEGTNVSDWLTSVGDHMCADCCRSSPNQINDHRRITTIASVSFKLNAFESAVVDTACSILSAVVPACAAGRTLKWKIAMVPSSIGFWPPESTQP